MSRKNDATKMKRIRKDYLMKKLKGRIMKCLNNVSNKIIGKGYIKQIDYKFIANVTKKFNIKLLKEKIWRIFSFDKDNRKIIQDNDYNQKFKKIMNMTLNKFINKIFLMKSNEFKKEYCFECQDLFENLKNKEKKKEYKIMKKILKKKLLTYFQNLHGRKLKNNLIEEYENQRRNQSKESNPNETNQNTLSNTNDTNQNTLSNTNETNQNTLLNPGEGFLNLTENDPINIFNFTENDPNNIFNFNENDPHPLFSNYINTELWE